ncbi:hypothetical protein V6N13_103318 [Hibiscus sabdariffa]
MKRTNHRDISSFFHKKIQKDIGSVSSPNLSISKASLQASSPSNNGSSDEHGEAQDIPQNQEKHVEVTSVHMDEVPIDNGRLSEFDVINLPHDPGKRRRISDFHPDDRDIVRRTYIQKQPCQPGNHEFPKTNISRKNCRFNPNLFQKHESWLEYSVEKDATFCFVCYLFKDDNTAGGDAFVGSGFRAWNRTNAFVKHVGGHMSAHNQTLGRLNDFKNQKTSISSVAQKNRDVSWLFGDVLAPLLNFVGGSPKRKEFLREKQAEHVVEALSLGQLESGTGLNQEIGLSKPGDTRWGSHFKTILNIRLGKLIGSYQFLNAYVLMWLVLKGTLLTNSERVQIHMGMEDMCGLCQG